ncbi:MAG: hypothetical protein KW806_02985, partial [Candidatus Yanofskybacteria bacterium]|nr:hypothetical protein [Candidatus Yanofskybacteria bacterium]
NRRTSPLERLEEHMKNMFVVLAVLFLAACGGGNPNGPGPIPTPIPTPTPVAREVLRPIPDTEFSSTDSAIPFQVRPMKAGVLDVSFSWAPSEAKVFLYVMPGDLPTPSQLSSCMSTPGCALASSENGKLEYRITPGTIYWILVFKQSGVAAHGSGEVGLTPAS